METLFGLVGFVAGIVGLVCYVLVLVKMFQNNQTVLGIICIVGLLVCGLGYLLAFIMGWVNAKRWNITNVMIVWTVCFVFGLVNYAMFPPDITAMRARFGAP